MATGIKYSQRQYSKPQLKAPRTRLEMQYPDFVGLDNSNDPASIPDSFSPDTLNTVLDSIGSVQTRTGYIKLLTTKLPASANNGREYYKSDGTKQLVYRQGQYLYRYDNAGGSVQIGGPWTSSVQDDFDVYNDVFYGVDGTNFYQYNGSSTASLVVPAGVFTTPQYLRVHRNRGWIAQGSTLYFSDAGNLTSWPVGNFLNVNTNDGQVITGIEVLLDALIVFKTDSIWIVTGDATGVGNNTVIGSLNLRRANSAVGCAAYKTIRKVENVLYFMSRGGIYIFQNYQARLMSQALNNTFRLDVNPNAINLSWAIFSPVQKKYLLGFASAASNTPDKVICYDLMIQHFTIWDHMPGAWAVNFRFSPIDTVVMGDSNQGNIYQLFQGYADIAGYNGTVSASSSTTITDSTASWTTNQFVDCRVQVGLGTGTTWTGVVTSNTATVLTVSGLSGAPTVNLAYTIGGYKSYWKSKILDFGVPEMSKRYKYLNLFADSEASYSLQVGIALDFSNLDFNQAPLSLNAGTVQWDQVGIQWDQAGVYYDTKLSLFKRSSMPGTGRFAQVMFGNFNANQPWRVFEFTISYKLRKARPT